MLKTIEIDLVYQNLIETPPKSAGNLYDRACSSDEVTVNAWREIWLKNYQATKDRFGSFADHSIGKLYNINAQKGAIVVGSGPSLKESIEALRENASMPNRLMTVSCLHNFGYFEDEGFHADFYLSLDSQKIVVQDVYEGRKHPPEHYWEATKGKKLLAYIGSDPSLFEHWQGEIYLFNCLIPDLKLREQLDGIEKFTHYVSSGGNALGGCMYVAKAIMGSDVIHYVGADFCFDYNNTFHSYKTHYDQPGGYVLWPDVFGILRKTWPSYLNFKFWFDHIAMNVPGRWVNCSFGTLGAYQGGNLRHFQYMSLKDALVPYQMADRVFFETRDDDGKVQTREEIRLKELFNNAQYDKDIVIF